MNETRTRHNAILPRSRAGFPSYVVCLADFMRSEQWGLVAWSNKLHPPVAASFSEDGTFQGWQIKQKA